MANPIEGKWTEVSQQNISEFYTAIGLPDPGPDTKATYEWTLEANGDWTEVFDVVVFKKTRTFKSGETQDDLTTTVEGNIITEVQDLGNGNALNAVRVFAGNTVTTTLTSNLTDIVANVVCEKQ